MMLFMQGLSKSCGMEVYRVEKCVNGSCFTVHDISTVESRRKGRFTRSNFGPIIT